MRTVELSHFLHNSADLLGRPNKLVVFSHFVMRTVKLSHFFAKCNRYVIFNTLFIGPGKYVLFVWEGRIEGQVFWYRAL